MKDLRSIRLDRGLGQRELALLAKVSLTELSQCERGLLLPDTGFFRAVSSALSVPLDELMRAQQVIVHEETPGEGYKTAQPSEEFVIPRRESIDSSLIPVMDLFCGVGGFSRGFELTGKFQVTTGVDLLPDRVATFSENHASATAFCGDIRKLRLDSLEAPKPEVLIGGPPCQGFSSIRPFRTLTEGDHRNNLFEYFALFVDKIKPNWFVFENVVGLLSHKSGETLKTIVDVFEGLGYTTEWKVLNAALYGLPQRRERLVIVGNRAGRKFEWPWPSHQANHRSMAGRAHGQVSIDYPIFSEVLKPARTVMDAIHDLPVLAAGESAFNYRHDVEPTDYERLLRGDENALTLHNATAHSNRMLEIIRKAGTNRAALPNGMTRSGFSSSYSRLDPDQPSVTLTVNFVHPASNKCIHPYQDRALTPREGARLQGFPDSFRFKGTRSQIVKQIGNAVPPVFGQVLADALFQQI
jgi:DNA (cytosine-5)-methyltransferase 1